jgi:hypothetical protein
MTRAWFLPVLVLLWGALVATGQALSGSPVEAAAFLLLFVILAYASSPLLFPRSIDAEEARRRSAADGRPVVFWRPGCTYCMRLRLRLGRAARRSYWVDIWRDPAGASNATADDTVHAPVRTWHV